MNNKLILDLTVRLTQALDQYYDVVNMDTVLAVLSALEGATITKEQLETTRLAKHINQLRRRNKSNILAIRAKNLLKTWREMVGITSQAQSEVATSVSQQVQSTQQQAPKPPLTSSSQPTSPYTTQLLGENLDNSLSSIGGGVEFSRTATGGVINTGSVNFAWSKKSSSAVGEGGGGGGGGGGITSCRSNGALTDTQIRLMKSSNRSTKSNNSPIPTGTTSKVKHPTSFKNLLTGFNANSVSNKQTNPSALSPKLKTTQMPCIDREEEPSLKTNSTTFVIDDDDNQSQPSTTTVVQTGGVSSPRTHKSTKRKDRDSPVTMVFIEHSNSPIPFENMSEENERNSQVARSNTSNNQVVTSTIDLPDSNSSSTFVSVLCEATNVVTGNGGALSSTSNSNTRIRKDKQGKHLREQIIESEHFQPNIDESSRIAFPLSGIQEYLALSNSSMSIFPSQQTAGSGGAERYPPKMGSNDDNHYQNSSIERNTEVVDGDLTFAGKFKQNTNSCGIEVGGSAGNYFSNGKENSALTASEFPCSNIKVVENNCRDSLSAGGTASTSTFLPFSRNSNDSTSNSRASQLDLIDVVNQDSQSMITADDLRQQQQSSNKKNKTARDVEPALDTQQVKYTKETSNKSKQLSKEQSKPAAVQRTINTSSKPSTPTPVPNAIPPNTLSSHATEQKVPKKRGRKKGSKGVDSVLAQLSGLSSQFLVSPALGSSKKVKTTMELLADIQNRKLGSATSSPTLMNWLGTSRPASSCSEPSLHSPRTSDVCSTNATVSTAARSTPEKNISNNSVAADELYESDSDSNTSGPSHDSVKVSLGIKDSVAKSIEADDAMVPGTAAPTTIEAQIKDLMAQLPPVNVDNIDWEAYEDVPCTCTLREVLPEAVVDAEANANEKGLELLKNVESIKSKDDDYNRHDDDEPIISVNVLPPAPARLQQQARSWSTTASAAAAQHSLSAPVSTVTSPVVPSANQRPMKSIFDLDFDDDNDPLYSFVEAATKTQNSKDTSTATENGRIKHSEEVNKHLNTLKTDYSDVGKSETQQSDATQQSSSIESASYQYPPAPLETNEPAMPPPMHFPTYEVVEDPSCQAKLRYDTQTNQITQFHINAFHNCFIPNVNGNWDHSMPQNIDDECHHMENDSLYANVVPNYGCFITERIPKDLSHVKFTKNFKPKHTDKSDKPPPPFLGVANIHRRQHFRLHHHHNHHRKHHKRTAGQRRRHTKVAACVKPEADQKLEIGIREENVEDEDQQKRKNYDERKAGKTNALPYIPEQQNSAPDTTEKQVTEVKEEIEHRLSPTHVPEISQINTHNTNLNNYSDKSSYQQQRTFNNHRDRKVADIDFFSDVEQSKREPDEFHSDHKSDVVIDMKRPIANGTVHHLVNNNSIVHESVEPRRDEDANNTKVPLQNNNHGLLIDGKEDEIAASRRSSSCSNSSLKQNQNSINMKLRRHRLAQRQAEMQKRHRKRKSLSAFNDVFEFEMEDDEQPKDPPLIKRIKIVNGGFADGRRLTNSITDSSCLEDDGDSDCYHVHSENDIITEEEIDEDGDEQAPKMEMDEDEDYEEIADDYDEEDGDDEEEPEEDYGDFREVVTRDMTSSTTGNNHIVLTIKKTPSKTNSPSSSSMSPAPIMNVNVKQPSISPTIRTADALLLGENALELPGETTEHKYPDKDKLNLNRKLIELSSVKTEDLIVKTELFLPEPTDVAVYSFELKKNGDIEHEDSSNEDNDSDERSHENTNEVPEELTDRAAAAELTEVTEGTENNQSEEKKEYSPKLPKINSKDSNVISKAKLSESILTTRRELRRLELKRRLKEGIEEAQKMHHQLFFPYELHTSIGSKILEINSCTSGCTDPSDDETDITDSDTSTSSTDDEDALFRVQKRKKTKLSSKRRTDGGGGGDPSSSSSSSSDTSDSNSTSSSYSAFTSWTTSSEDEDKKPPLTTDKKEDTHTDEQHLSPDLNDTESDVELPLENNYLLRSFNHIYVSTEERRRQQQLKEAAEYRRREVMNAGYITITGDDSKDDTATPLIPSLTPSDNCDVYTNYYNNPTYNLYSNSNNSNGITSCNSLLTTKLNLTTNAETSKPIESTVGTGGTSNFEVIETPPTERSSEMLDFLIEQTSHEDQKPAQEDVISKNASSNQNDVNIEKSSRTKSNPRSSHNSIDGQSKMQNTETVQKSDEEQLNDETMVPQEEYRTGLRQVDEDVDDEDGNNCARTQQFKEWHEVLQLRSYNDELLTVLPYVVIE